jgi:hypothetical protein
MSAGTPVQRWARYDLGVLRYKLWKLLVVAHRALDLRPLGPSLVLALQQEDPVLGGLEVPSAHSRIVSGRTTLDGELAVSTGDLSHIAISLA